MTPAPDPAPMTPARMAAIHAASFTLPPPWGAQALADTLTSPGTFVLSRAAGFLIGRVIADEAELITLAVAPEARRAGLGAALLTGFHARATAEGARSGFLEVAAANAPARALYARHGWQEAGRRRGYYRSADGQARDDALILTTAFFDAD